MVCIYFGRGPDVPSDAVALDSAAGVLMLEGESKARQPMAAPEDKIRTALTWAKENGYTVVRSARYEKFCDGIHALLLHNKQDGSENAAKILEVDANWIRAFNYGFAGCAPRLAGSHGVQLEKPAEAYQLGLKLGLEYCGETPWKFPT